jgi:hypothetical protein
MLSKLTICDYVFFNTPLSELIGTYFETQNDIWLSVIFNQALQMGFGVAFDEEKILSFENEACLAKSTYLLQRQVQHRKPSFNGLGIKRKNIISGGTEIAMNSVYPETF